MGSFGFFSCLVGDSSLSGQFSPSPCSFPFSFTLGTFSQEIWPVVWVNQRFVKQLAALYVYSRCVAGSGKRPDAFCTASKPKPLLDIGADQIDTAPCFTVSRQRQNRHGESPCSTWHCYRLPANPGMSNPWVAPGFLRWRGLSSAPGRPLGTSALQHDLSSAGTPGGWASSTTEPNSVTLTEHRTLLPQGPRDPPRHPPPNTTSFRSMWKS